MPGNALPILEYFYDTDTFRRIDPTQDNFIRTYTKLFTIILTTYME